MAESANVGLAALEPQPACPEEPPKDNTRSNDETPAIGSEATTSNAPTSDAGPEPPSPEGTPPPLPPRRQALSITSDSQSRSPAGSFRAFSSAQRPKPTTALSLADVQTQSHAGNETLTVPPSRQTTLVGQLFGVRRASSDGGDSASVNSYGPTLGAAAEIQSMLGDTLPAKSSRDARGISEGAELFPADTDFEEAFEHEFDELDDITSDGLNEEAVIQQWKSKLKHFIILSSAGKPIWTRHGNDQIVTSYVGVVQTLISFYQDNSDELRCFVTADVTFVVMTRGSLHLVAISHLDESTTQLRVQLEALYMQILSTLTLPVMERMFKNRASTDLRRPLQGTEKLLSALSDGFTRGSPSTLLSALECLKLRKSQRNVINNSMLKAKRKDLLYGLLVAGGRLVSVVRPRKHSLHPGDLHLIFNMLFEAGSVKAGEGESWIPLCLPGFNNTGYVYMYVSYLDLEHPTDQGSRRPTASFGEDGEVAVVLISTNKESFYEMRQMRDKLVDVCIALNVVLSNLTGVYSSCGRTAASTSFAVPSIAVGPGATTSHQEQSSATSYTNREAMYNSSCPRMNPIFQLRGNDDGKWCAETLPLSKCC